MKLSALYLDDMVVIPEGKVTGEGQPRVDLRDQSFHASEGWDIRETLPGVFSLLCEGMSAPVTVGGYGYSYVAAPFVDSSLPAQVDAGSNKRRKR